MKKVFGVFLSIVILLQMLVPCMVFAKWNEYPLTWGGQSATLEQIAQNTGYDFVDNDGNYIPMYFDCAKMLWEQGLLLGSNGSFDLDKPIKRVEGVVMVLRLLGKENEAKQSTAANGFTDVPNWAKAQVAYAAQSGITAGYSSTRFGSDDAMTANQYITFVLRAMGYKDNTDFTWDKAADMAHEIGLIGKPCLNQYANSNLFLRDNVAVISYNALFYAPKKDGGILIDGIVVPGKPEGSVPTAVRAAAPVTPPTPAEPEQPDQTVEGIIYYDTFPAVPSYRSIDPAVQETLQLSGVDHAYYFCKPEKMNITGYEALLKTIGFSRTGTVNILTPKVTFTVYSTGNIHVAFGRMGNEVCIRIVEMYLDTMSADSIRTLAMMFNKMP